MIKPIIPVAALQQHIAVLGKTRSGKSSVMRGLVEGLLDQKHPVCIIDPKGDWWGIKLARDGKQPGYPVVIFGGEHADVPINAHAGAHVAELFATGNRPCLIDLGGWMVGERTRFWIEFASSLFRLTRGMRWLVVDEVHNFAPKGKIMDPDAGKALHWTNRLASEGLGKGLPMIFASQRPQKVHNDTLTSAETLIAMRVLHPSDRGAVSDWIKGCGDPVLGAQVLNTLAQMDRGEGWAWSPEIGFGPERVKFPMFRTYDSFRPQSAEDTKALKGWAEIDLDEVKAKLADVVKEARANDPKLLRGQLAAVQQEINKLRNSAKANADPGPTPAWQAQYEEAHAKDTAAAYGRGVVDGWNEAVAKIEPRVHTAQSALAAANEFLVFGAAPEAAKQAQNIPKKIPPARNLNAQASASVSRIAVRRESGPGVVDKPMPRAMLTALAQHPQGLTKGQLLTHTGYRSSGSTSTCFADLASNGWVVPDRGRLAITDAGLKVLGDFEPLPTGGDLRAHLLNGSKCSPMEKAILKVLFEAYPDAIAKGDILKSADYASSGSTSTAFARLVTLGYAQAMGYGQLRAGQDLFT